MTQQNTPLVPIGQEIVLAGYKFIVVGHTTDRNGRQVEIPGACTGKASRGDIAAQSKRTRHSVAAVPSATATSAPTTEPSPPNTPLSATPRDAAKPRSVEGRSPAPARSYYEPRNRQRTQSGFQPKPPPLVIHQEPASLGVWICRVAVAALVAAAIWFYNQGNEQRKWEKSVPSSATTQRK
jgi:hypothetical protein